MEYVFIYVEFISLVSCAVVCSVPYVRREVYGFGWLPECLMSMPSSLCSQAHQHRHSTPHTNISSQQYLQNVDRKKQHLCQHISRMVPLYRIFVSPSFTSLRRGTYGENESNHLTNHHQHEEHGTGREDMLCISVCVCVIVYSVVIFILFASFAFGSINMSNYALMAVEGKQRTKGGKKLNANTHPTFSIREWIIIWVPLLTLVGCCCCCYQTCSLCDVCSAHNPDVTISVQYGFILLPRQIYEGRKKNIQWEGRQVVCESISVDICLLLRDSVLFIYKPFVIQYDLFPFFFEGSRWKWRSKNALSFFWHSETIHTHTQIRTVKNCFQRWRSHIFRNLDHFQQLKPFNLILCLVFFWRCQLEWIFEYT